MVSNRQTWVRGGGANRNLPLNKSRRKSVSAILKAAEVEFSLSGYAGTTISGIAARAKVCRTSINYYFENKHNLYLAVFERIVELWNERWKDISEDDDPGEAVERYIRNKIELSKSQPMASKIFATEIIYGAPFLKSYLVTIHTPWVREKSAIIQSWIERGKMDPVGVLGFFRPKTTLIAVRPASRDFPEGITFS